MLTMSVTAAVNVGFLGGMILGYVCGFRAVLVAFSLPTLGYLVGSWGSQESPVWLARRGRTEEVRGTLRKLR